MFWLHIYGLHIVALQHVMLTGDVTTHARTGPDSPLFGIFNRMSESAWVKYSSL